MLGENHSIHNEFPEHRSLIDHLSTTNPEFKKMVEEHNRMDKTIRGLEERESPIDDKDMEQMKLKRLQLKDSIYQLLSRSQ